MTDGNAADENADSRAAAIAGKRRRIHWRSGVGILLGGVIAETIVLAKYADDDTLKIYITLKFVFPIVAGLFILWWLFRSGFSRHTRVVGVVAVLSAALLFNLIVRLDGFYGVMWPRFSLRWTETSEQRVARYLESAHVSPAGASGSTNGAVPATTSTPQSVLEIADADWPRFRGALGDSVVRDVAIRTDWKKNPPTAVWRHPIGPAWSSFAVVGSRLFTQEQRGEREAVVCYDASTGRQLWEHSDPVRYSTTMGGIGPRATPTVFDSRVYTLGATGILNCLDPLTGKVFWSTNILDDAEADNLDWGMAGSPLVYDDVVVVNPGGEQGRAIIVYDRLSGNQRWARGDDRAGYAAPQMATLRGTRQLIVYDASGVAGYNPSDGSQWWRFSWTNSDRINVAQPIVREASLVFISSGYGTGSALLEINVESGEWTRTPRWQRPGQFKLKFNDAVYQDGYLYGLDEGILSCIEYHSGQRMWKRGRYGHGQILLLDDDDLLLIQAEKGDVVLVEATPRRFLETARFTVLDGMTWNHPVVNRGFLFVRNSQEAACYDLRPNPTTGSSE